MAKDRLRKRERTANLSEECLEKRRTTERERIAEKRMNIMGEAISKNTVD